MSIASEITRIQNAKEDIKTSIENKGVIVPSTTTLDGYSALIDNISGGGGADLSDYFNLTPPTDASYNKIIKGIPANLIDTSNVTNMSYMFNTLHGLLSLDLSGWNTSRVTSMNGMFYGCSALTTLDLSDFDTSAVQYMLYMFQNCERLTTLDLSGWNTSRVTNMNNMFYGCSALTTLDLSDFDTSAVQYMLYMFQNCERLTTLDLSGWNTSRVTNMNNMFYGCSALTSITFGANWKSSGTQTYTNQTTGTWTNTTTGVSYTGLQNLLAAGRTQGAIEGTWVKS